MAKHILIVDDEKSMVEELQEILESEGYQVSSAGEGKTACEIFDANSIDLVLLDIKMPHMSGVEVNKHMHKSDPSIPVIIVTGSFEKKNALQAVNEGAKTILYKPFDPEKLLELIRLYLT